MPVIGPPGPLSVNVDAVRVVASMSCDIVAWTVVLAETLTAAAPGAVDDTDGGGTAPAAVVNDQEAFVPIGMPPVDLIPAANVAV